MTTINEAIGGFLESALKNPKSTWSAILTCALFVVPSLLAGGVIHGKAAAVASSLLMAAKLYVGGKTLDAPNFKLPSNSKAEINVPAGSTIEQTTNTKVTP